MSSTRLKDLGERRLLREVIPRFAQGVGDDCAIFQTPDRFCAVTTDPVPRPAAWSVSEEQDLFWLGWLLVTINGSDIAAAGAQPHSFFSALDLPSETELTSFERLLVGIRACCDRLGFRYLGGNVREAMTVGAVGTAIGFSRCACLTRRGARPGSRVAVIGCGGQFWSDVLRARAGEKVDESTSPLFSPIARVKEMAWIHEEGFAECAMDGSDGLAPTLVELARVNELDIVVDLKSIRKASKDLTKLERPERLWMGWGDWLVVISIGEEKLRRFRQAAEVRKLPVTVIGRFLPGEGGVRLRGDVAEIPLDRLESERFMEDSWFGRGMEYYEQMLRSLRLPE